jgi:FkbM family methyltransferase
MIETFLNLYALIFARPSFRKLNYLLMQIGLRGIGVLNYRTAYLSGEDSIAKRCIQQLDNNDGVVLDIGANEGEFTALILSASRNLRIISFEPHPQTYLRLQKRFAVNQKRVEVVNCALGNQPGEISLFDYSDTDGSEHASVFREVIEGTRGRKAREHKVKLLTLDALEIKGKIKLIKIDVEGFELSVLQGARKLLADKQPQYIVIEFNEMNVNSRTFLKDLTIELSEYKVERILPGGRTLKLNNPYRPWTHEIFAYQNLLFTRLTVDENGSYKASTSYDR